MDKYFILFVLLLSLIIIYFSSINSYKENFVPRKIKQFYRPFSRNVRLNYEGFYDRTTSRLSNILRKFGI